MRQTCACDLERGMVFRRYGCSREWYVCLQALVRGGYMAIVFLSMDGKSFMWHYFRDTPFEVVE